MRAHELVDTFDGPNPALVYGGPATATGGRLVLPLRDPLDLDPDTGQPIPVASVTSAAPIDLTESHLVVEAVTIPTTARSRVEVTLVDADEDATGEFLSWVVVAGAVQAVRYIDQDEVIGWSAPYSPADHRWLAIRHEFGVIVWATSGDGVAWTDRAMLATNMPVDTMTLHLRATLRELADPGEDDGLTPAPAELDNLGAPPVVDNDDPLTGIAAAGAPNIAIDLSLVGDEGLTFVLDESELDGPAVLGWGDNPAGWVNVVCDVQRVQISRGLPATPGPLAQAEAGTASVQLVDTERRIDPTLNGDVVHPGTPVRVRAWGPSVDEVLVQAPRRRNRARNSRAALTISGWGGNSGSGGASTPARRDDGSPAGGTYVRRTWTTAPTNVSGGNYYGQGSGTAADNGHAIDVTPGEVVSYTVHARPSKAQRLQGYVITYRGTDNGAVSLTPAGASRQVAAGVWEEWRGTVTVPADAARMIVLVYAVSGTGGTPWAVGDWLDMTGVVVESGDTPGPWFDGGTSAYEWTGAAGASPSREAATGRVNLVPDPRGVGTAWYSPAFSTLSVASGRLQATITGAPTGPTGAYVYARPTGTGAASRFPITPGQRAAMRAKITNRGPVAVTAFPGFGWYAWNGTSYASAGSSRSTAAPVIEPGASVIIEWIATAPVTATHLFPIFYLARGSSAPAVAGDVFEIDEVALLIGNDAPAVGPVPYFDGDTEQDPGEGALTYTWEGTAHASPSVEHETVVELRESTWSAVLFTGRVSADGISVAYARADPPTVTFTAVDLVGTLSRWEAVGHPDPGVGAGDTLLGRVERVLDEVGADDAVAVPPDPAYVATLAPAKIDRAWPTITEAAVAELGRVWATRENRLAVRARGALLAGPVRGTLSDWHGEVADESGVHCCYVDPSVRYSPEQVTNRAIGGRSGAGAAPPVQHDDEESQARFDVHVVRETALDLETDGQVPAWCRALLTYRTQPQVRIESVSPAPWGAPDAWRAVCLTDIGDRWHFRLHPQVGPTVIRTLGVQRVEHEIGPDGWSIVWATGYAPTPGTSPTGWFTLDVSELGSGDLLAPFA